MTSVWSRPFIHMRPDSADSFSWGATCDRCPSRSHRSTHDLIEKWVHQHLVDWHGGVDRHDD